MLQRDAASAGGEGAAHEDVHREALERERREAEVAGQRHLEDLDVLHDRHRVVPLRARTSSSRTPTGRRTAGRSARRLISRSHRPARRSPMSDSPPSRALIGSSSKMNPSQTGAARYCAIAGETRKGDSSIDGADGDRTRAGRRGRDRLARYGLVRTCSRVPARPAVPARRCPSSAPRSTPPPRRSPARSSRTTTRSRTSAARGSSAARRSTSCR